MITIIFAPPRFGKTAYLTYILNELCFDNLRYHDAFVDISKKNRHGFNIDMLSHLIYANYPITFRKFNYSPRFVHIVNPFCIGFCNDNVDVVSLPNFAVIGITEAQTYFNSRKSLKYPSWQSRFYEQHGHNHLDVYLDVQRVDLIDVNIRELSRFIEIVELKIIYKDKKNKIIKKMKWLIREIENYYMYQKYINSAKQDKDLYEEKTIVCNYNVFDLYNSYSCQPKFFEKIIKNNEQFYDKKCKDYDYDKLKDNKEYLNDFKDDIPNNFYK